MVFGPEGILKCHRCFTFELRIWMHYACPVLVPGLSCQLSSSGNEMDSVLLPFECSYSVAPRKLPANNLYIFVFREMSS